MTPDEWRRIAETHLRQREDRWDHETANSGGDADLTEWFDYEDRLAQVRAMSPRLSREEAQEELSKLARKGSGAGRPANPLAMQQSWCWRMAGHVRSLAHLWDELFPERPRRRPPIHPAKIVTAHFGLSHEEEQRVVEYANRPASRWPEKDRP